MSNFYVGAGVPVQVLMPTQASPLPTEPYSQLQALSIFRPSVMGLIVLHYSSPNLKPHNRTCFVNSVFAEVIT